MTQCICLCVDVYAQMCFFHLNDIKYTVTHKISPEKIIRSWTMNYVYVGPS